MLLRHINNYGDLFTEAGPISRLGITTATLNKTTDLVARGAMQNGRYWFVVGY